MHEFLSGDSKESHKSMNETFYYTNIVPQNHENNKGYWYKLENFCRKLTEKYSNVYVVSGPLFIAEKNTKSGEKFVKYQVIEHFSAVTVSLCIWKNSNLEPGSCVKNILK